MIDKDTFLATCKTQIVRRSMDGKVEVLHEGTNMENCIPCFASAYMVICDQDGEMVVFESSIFEEVQKYMPGIEYKHK